MFTLCMVCDVPANAYLYDAVLASVLQILNIVQYIQDDREANNNNYAFLSNGSKCN